ncbi:MAG: helix-turn-helix transcriptional regulator [Oscillospiraceae bacterium]|nr:helix-turn-helix transcriptional regulator [Oscillospiraceae bacterium]
MNSKPTEIGERIKKARKTAGLNQTELATRLNKTLRTVQKYESGEIKPSIAMVNEIAKILEISPADLIGYKKPEICIESMSDVIAVLHQLRMKANLRFEIDVAKPPHHDGWSCAIRFDGQDQNAPVNASLCLFLEEYAKELEKLDTYWTDRESLDLWVEKRLAYHADTVLEDKKETPLTLEERIRRRNELDRQMLEQLKKAGTEE